EWTPATAFHVYPVPETSPPQLLRYPVTTRDAAARRPYRDRVLAVDAAEPAEKRHRAASVLTWTESTLSLEEASDWAASRLDEHRGATVAVAALRNGGYFVRSRREGSLLADSDARLELAALGAAVFLHTRAAESPGVLHYSEGRRQITVRLSPVDD
ncbi:MAG: hypothetical protein ACRD0P_31500, partial [Stackebrandtia sp.]